MHDNDFIHQLRDRLRNGPDGLILPWTFTTAQRFQSASETMLFPVLRDMAKEFRDGGIDATPYLDLEEDPPVVGICFETLPLSLHFSPSKNPNALTFSKTTKWAEPSGNQEISYRNLNKDKIRDLIEQALKRAINPTRPPL